MLENKSGNISETRKDGGKVTMETGEPIETHQRPVETPPGPTPTEMDRPGPDGQRNPPGGPVEASDIS